MSNSFIHLIKAEDCKDFDLTVPVITILNEDETPYFDAKTVERKIGTEAWKNLSAKYTSLMVESHLIVEDFDPICSF